MTISRYFDGRICIGLLACGIIFAGSTRTFAYQEDTHFLMTYVACRSAGLTDGEALIVAAVDQGMDDSPAVNAHNGALPHVLEEWVWHALDKDGKMGPTGLIARRDELFQDALNEKDPRNRLIRLGVFFHYQQDTWAHRHHEKDNHLSRDAFTTFNTPAGHASFGDNPDRPPIDPVAALMSLEDGLQYAADFVRSALGRAPNPFLNGYVPAGGKIDDAWKDKRKGKYFNQIDLAPIAPGSARLFVNSLIRAQIDAYTASRDANPNYLGRDTPDKADLDKVRTNLQRVCDEFRSSVGTIVIPTTKQKLDQGFAMMTTSGLLSLGSPTKMVTPVTADTVLRPGDLMFKYVDLDNRSGLPVAGVGFEALISAGQKVINLSSTAWNNFIDAQNSDLKKAVAKGDSRGVHMAIYIGNGWLAEAYGTSLSGASVNKWALFKAHDHQSWYVFRPKDKAFSSALADVAGKWATGRMKYLIPIQALVTSSAFGPKAKEQALVFGDASDTPGGPPSINKMFCSQFAVAAAQSAAIKLYLTGGKPNTTDQLDRLPDFVKLDSLSTPSTFYGVLEQSSSIEKVGMVFVESSQ